MNHYINHPLVVRKRRLQILHNQQLLHWLAPWPLSSWSEWLGLHPFQLVSEPAVCTLRLPIRSSCQECHHEMSRSVACFWKAHYAESLLSARQHLSSWGSQAQRLSLRLWAYQLATAFNQFTWVAQPWSMTSAKPWQAHASLIPPKVSTSRSYSSMGLASLFCLIWRSTSGRVHSWSFYCAR